MIPVQCIFRIRRMTAAGIIMHRNVKRCALSFHLRDLSFMENIGSSLTSRAQIIRVTAGIAQLLARKVLAMCS